MQIKEQDAVKNKTKHQQDEENKVFIEDLAYQKRTQAVLGCISIDKYQKDAQLK